MRFFLLLFVVLLFLPSVLAHGGVDDGHDEPAACGITFTAREEVPLHGAARVFLFAGFAIFILGITAVFLVRNFRPLSATVAGLGLLFALAAFAYLTVYPVMYRNSEGIGLVGGVHEHANLAVFINGRHVKIPVNVEHLGYVETHDAPGVIHKHARGVTLGHVFRMFGGDINGECMTWGGKEYCNTEDDVLKLYVNGRANMVFGSYVFSDLDRILVSYGNESKEELQQQWLQVADDACIYSDKCPEIGSAPSEGCAVSE